MVVDKGYPADRDIGINAWITVTVINGFFADLSR